MAVQRQTCLTDRCLRFQSHAVVLFLECVRCVILFTAVVTGCQFDIQVIQLQGVDGFYSYVIAVLLHIRNLAVSDNAGIVQTAGVFCTLRQSRVYFIDPVGLFAFAGIGRAVYGDRHQFDLCLRCACGVILFTDKTGIAVLELELCILIAGQFLGYAGRQFYNNRELLGIWFALDCTFGIGFFKAPPVAVRLSICCAEVVREICDHLVRLQIKLQRGNTVTVNIRRRLTLCVSK